MTLNEQIIECEKLVSEAEGDMMRKFWAKTLEELKSQLAQAYENAPVKI